MPFQINGRTWPLLAMRLPAAAVSSLTNHKHNKPNSNRTTRPTGPGLGSFASVGVTGGHRGRKRSLLQGGIGVPFIARWPGKIPANRVSHAIFATIDFLPTLARLSKFEVPSDRVIDGVDQTELLLGKSDLGARNSFYYQGNAVRQGKWKYLIASQKVPGYARDLNRTTVEELYDLKADIGETTNLAEKFPDKVAVLRELLQDIKNKR